MAAKGATIQNSTIVNDNTNVKNTAGNNSKINSGIQADGATIQNSTINNTNQNVTNSASNNSSVNSGISF